MYTDKRKVAGLGSLHSPSFNIETIYHRYIQAFKKGVYNYIKEEQDPLTQKILPRKYFSGGMNFAMVTPLGMKGISGLLKIISTFKLPVAGSSLVLANVNFTPYDLITIPLFLSLK